MTGRTGAAAKAGHDLVIEVTDWTATLVIGEGAAASSVALDADATSLRVREGTGGMQALGEKDKASIRQTIDEDVLRGGRIEFHSTEVQIDADRGRIGVRGDLSLVGAVRPVAFDLIIGDGGRLSARCVLRQTEWGIKPYSTLFGALKVADEVEVSLSAGPL
jgi:polyisoprenoid-binding protein YceI